MAEPLRPPTSWYDEDWIEDEVEVLDTELQKLDADEPGATDA